MDKPPIITVIRKLIFCYLLKIPLKEYSLFRYLQITYMTKHKVFGVAKTIKSQIYFSKN